MSWSHPASELAFGHPSQQVDAGLRLASHFCLFGIQQKKLKQTQFLAAALSF